MAWLQRAALVPDNLCSPRGLMQHCVPQRRPLTSALLAVFVVVASSCHDGMSGNEPASADGGALAAGVEWPVRPETREESARFLLMATFGPTEAEIDQLMIDGYREWFAQQGREPVSLTRPILEARAQASLSNYASHRVFAWRSAAVRGADQLRQRMAFALSQILVCSDAPSGVGHALSMAEYQDILARNALGDFRQLLEDVALSGAMGKYLSMAKNRQGNAASNTRPDENFAREILQLFSIGLVELRMDGSLSLDALGQPVPAYGQQDIESLARVLTGWSYANSSSFEWAPTHPAPMKPYPAYHDPGTVSILGGQVIQGGLAPRQRLERALDIICGHANVAPFLSMRLIQRLTTSNPSSRYIQRVAATFEDDGQGRRGNLFAVVKAILMDPEVWSDCGQDFGRLREPVLREVALIRSLGGFTRRAEGPLDLEFESWTWHDYGQVPLQSPSVFNFYLSDHRPAGEFSDRGMAAPEFQITTAHNITALTNVFYSWAFDRHSYSAYTVARDTIIDYSPWQPLAASPVALVDRLAIVLGGDRMTSARKAQIAQYLQSVPMQSWSQEPSGLARVREAVYLIATSPDCAVRL